MREVSQEARLLGVAIGFLEDHQDDYADTFGERFAEGHGQAIYNAKQIYIKLSGAYNCDCEDVGSVDGLADGSWWCPECRTTVVGPSEEVPPE